MNKIYIRTEANKITAMGHMARCMTIADAIKKSGGEAVFIVAEKDSERFPIERGHKVICLNRKWNDFDGEIPVISKLIETESIDTILVDSYFVTEKYMSALNDMVNLAYIDDLYERVWPVKTVINYASYASNFPYEKDYPNAVRLLGPSYFPLREEFKNCKKRIIPERVRRVLVVTGGSDEYHFMMNFLTEISSKNELNDIRFRFVCGTFNQDLDELKQKAVSFMNVDILETLPSLKSEMEEADLIITAGGTTLYEAAATGLPIICYSFVDNQLFNVKSFDEGGYGIYVGDLRQNFSFEMLADRVRDIADDKDKRNVMSENLFKLVDGKGAERIANKLILHL